MMRILPNGWFRGDMSKLSEEQLQEIKLCDERTSLYNGRNEILWGLAYKAESLGYNNPKDCPETKEQFEIVMTSYNKKIEVIDK